MERWLEGNLLCFEIQYLEQMKKYEHKEIDEEGRQILESIGGAKCFNKWMYETIKPWCTGKVLEIGSGIGNISQFLVNDGFEIMLSDLREDYFNELSEKFKGRKELLGITQMNIVDPEFSTRFHHFIGSFDTIFALNVVEHILDDTLAVENCKSLLKPGGNLIILVPAYQSIYGSIDKALEHYRRYNKKSLTSVFNQNKFRIIHRQYFNFIGIFGWFIFGKIIKQRTIGGEQMKLYSILVPIFRIIDKIVFQSMGLSVIVVGKK